MFADVIDLVGVLTRAAWAVLVRLVLQDFHAAALATALLSALFLQEKAKSIYRFLNAMPRPVRAPNGSFFLNTTS